MKKVTEEQYRTVMHKAMDLFIDNYDTDYLRFPFPGFSVLRNIHLTKKPKNFNIREIGEGNSIGFYIDIDKVGIEDKIYEISINYNLDSELGSYPWKECELEIFGQSHISLYDERHGKEGQLESNDYSISALGLRMDYERSDVSGKTKTTEFYLMMESFDALSEVMEDYLSRYRDGSDLEPDRLESFSVKRKTNQPVGFVNSWGDDV